MNKQSQEWNPYQAPQHYYVPPQQTPKTKKRSKQQQQQPTSYPLWEAFKNLIAILCLIAIGWILAVATMTGGAQ